MLKNRHIISVLLFLSASLVKPFEIAAQRGNGTGTFLELEFGSSNAVKPYTQGYRSSTFGFFHAGMGMRRMMNDFFGYRFYSGYDKINSAKGKNSLPFQTNYLRLSLQGSVDAGAVLRFRDFTKKFTILIYGGFGGSHMFNAEGRTGTMMNLTAGVIPQLKLSDRVRVYLDFCRVRHIYQQVTFDLNSSHNELGFDGLILDASIGIAINLDR